MSKAKESILCDNCKTELIEESAYPHKFVLQLSVIDAIRHRDTTQYAIAMLPPFKNDKHFCNKECLLSWLTK